MVLRIYNAKEGSFMPGGRPMGRPGRGFGHMPPPPPPRRGRMMGPGPGCGCLGCLTPIIGIMAVIGAVIGFLI